MSGPEAPSSNLQAPGKPQIPNSRATAGASELPPPHDRRNGFHDLVLGAWCFSGGWSLGFGAFPHSPSRVCVIPRMRRDWHIELTPQNVRRSGENEPVTIS